MGRLVRRASVCADAFGAEIVGAMKPGSIIVDLGADGGGNCELSKPGQTVKVGGVTILAPLNLPATVPYHASLLFSRNLTSFVQAFTKDKAFQLDFNDDIKRLGKPIVAERYGNLFDMYNQITGENAYETQMRIFPAVH